METHEKRLDKQTFLHIVADRLLVRIFVCGDSTLIALFVQNKDKIIQFFYSARYRPELGFTNTIGLTVTELDDTDVISTLERWGGGSIPEYMQWMLEGELVTIVKSGPSIRTTHGIPIFVHRHFGRIQENLINQMTACKGNASLCEKYLVVLRRLEGLLNENDSNTQAAARQIAELIQYT
ncbi:MAG: hypothetical protein AAB501_01250 [Patescibacteria group bacterium]